MFILSFLILIICTLTFILFPKSREQILKGMGIYKTKKMENKFAIAYHTVDIIPYTFISDTEVKILLGQKPNSVKYVTIGGFLDPTDDSAEMGAIRELNEEAGFSVELALLKYVGSAKIDDPRYKESTDKIITSLFCVEVPFSVLYNSKAGDDIQAVELFNLHNLKGSEFEIISDHHKILLEKFYSYIFNNGIN